MNNNKQKIRNKSDQSNDDYNCITAVEQVYPEDIFNNAQHITQLSTASHDMPFDPQRAAANDAYNGADIYALNSVRMAKHDRSLERRSAKSKLTDRRSNTRLSATGEAQPDRRADNRAANVASIRLSIAASEEEQHSVS